MHHIKGVNELFTHNEMNMSIMNGRRTPSPHHSISMNTQPPSVVQLTIEMDKLQRQMMQMQSKLMNAMGYQTIPSS